MAEEKTSRRANAQPPAITKPPKSNHKKPFSALLKRLTSLRSVASSSHLTAPTERYGATGTASTDRSHNSTSSTKSRGSQSTNRGRASSASAGEGASLKRNSIPSNSVARASVDSFLNRPDRPASVISQERDVKPSNSTISTSYYSNPTDFSSRTPSIRSVTTTLTTIHSTLNAYNPHPNHHHNPNAAPSIYSNPMPNPNNPNLDAISPSQTYQSATANGLLTDNASVITLASSTRHRRRSFDTDASVRGLAPSSLWGGSRESLPLSILSQNLENRATGERASLYGRALETASRQAVEAASPLGSPNRESFGFTLGNGPGNGASSRRSSAWGVLIGQEGSAADDSRSFKSGPASLRGSLRSARSNPRLQTEGFHERSNSNIGESVKADVNGNFRDVKGKGKEVINGYGGSSSK